MFGPSYSQNTYTVNGSITLAGCIGASGLSWSTVCNTVRSLCAFSYLYWEFTTGALILDIFSATTSYWEVAAADLKKLDCSMKQGAYVSYSELRWAMPKIDWTALTSLSCWVSEHTQSSKEHLATLLDTEHSPGEQSRISSHSSPIVVHWYSTSLSYPQSTGRFLPQSWYPEIREENYSMST